MTIRLSVRTAIWRSHVARFASSVDGLVPVIKGNGYGFGRHFLAGVAAEFCDTVAVGTVHELDALPDGLTPVVLTPTLAIPAPSVSGSNVEPILTVGRPEHLAALTGWQGRVIVKISTSMRRFGADASLVEAAQAVGLDVVGVSLHPPLAGTDDDRVGEIRSLIAGVDPVHTVWLSHLGPDAYASLPTDRSYRLRVGTALWHGDKSALRLTADVLDVRTVRSGDQAGYRLGPVPVSGHLVMIGAGSANGVAALDGSLSPFHFGRTRMVLHEPPHMHTSMAFVPHGDPLPEVGDWVDVQRPLHMTTVDEYRWL